MLQNHIHKQHYVRRMIHLGFHYIWVFIIPVTFIISFIALMLDIQRKQAFYCYVTNNKWIFLTNYKQLTSAATKHIILQLKANISCSSCQT
jgi:hypothetical protein